jgi:hypothetical protein
VRTTSLVREQAPVKPRTDCGPKAAALTVDHALLLGDVELAGAQIGHPPQIYLAVQEVRKFLVTNLFDWWSGGLVGWLVG